VRDFFGPHWPFEDAPAPDVENQQVRFPVDRNVQPILAIDGK
jgi:hypothetical protein